MSAIVTAALYASVFVASAVAAAVALALYRAFGLKGVPSAGPLWFVRNEPRYTMAAREARERLGGVYLAWLGLEPMVTLACPDAIQAVLTDIDGAPKDFPVADGALFSPLAKTSMNNVNGDTWTRQRGIMSPALVHGSLRAFYAGPFTECTRRAMDTLELMRRDAGSSAPVNVVPLMRAYALDVLGIAGFSQSFGGINVVRANLAGGGGGGGGEAARRDPHAERVAAAYETVVNLCTEPARAMFPQLDYVNGLPTSAAFRDAVNVFREYLGGMVRERRERHRASKGAKGDARDFLDCLVEAAEAQQLSDDEVESNAFLFYLAGHDTTQIALSWTVALLAEYQDVQERARAEVDEVLPDGRLPAYDDLKRMPYILSVVSESMRLYAPASALPTRRAARKLTLPGGQVVPRGAVVNIAVDAVHHDPKHWPNPARFDPDRFSPAGRQGRHPYAYIPFSLGRRVCAGRQFSLAEQQLFVAALLTRYRVLSAEPIENVKLKKTIFLFNMPAAVNVRLEPRTK